MSVDSCVMAIYFFPFLGFVISCLAIIRGRNVAAILCLGLDVCVLIVDNVC